MSKMIRLEDDVYSALKGYALREGKTLSAAVYALMHTADCGDLIEKRFSSLESQIAELKSLLLLDESFSLHKIQNRWARGDSNARPSPCKYGGFRAF
jgi:hypothetical protein